MSLKRLRQAKIGKDHHEFVKSHYEADYFITDSRQFLPLHSGTSLLHLPDRQRRTC